MQIASRHCLWKSTGVGTEIVVEMTPATRLATVFLFLISVSSFDDDDHAGRHLAQAPQRDRIDDGGLAGTRTLKRQHMAAGT